MITFSSCVCLRIVCSPLAPPRCITWQLQYPISISRLLECQNTKSSLKAEEVHLLLSWTLFLNSYIIWFKNGHLLLPSLASRYVPLLIVLTGLVGDRSESTHFQSSGFAN